MEQEDLDMPVGLYMILIQPVLGEAYDFIVSTVVLMFCKQTAFLQLSKICRSIPDPVATILSLCHEYEDYPQLCELPFTFKRIGRLLQDWELVKYNENPGHLHRRDENGSRIQLRFATMLAKKIK